jgi:hypothetical protein
MESLSCAHLSPQKQRKRMKKNYKKSFLNQPHRILKKLWNPNWREKQIPHQGKKCLTFLIKIQKSTIHPRKWMGINLIIQRTLKSLNRTNQNSSNNSISWRNKMTFSWISWTATKRYKSTKEKWTSDYLLNN